MMIKNIILCVLFCSSISYAQDQDTGASYNLFKSKTYVKNPLDLRDPFKRRINKKKGQQQKIHEIGTYTNSTDAIENKPVESIRIVGVMIGKERRAIAKLIDSSGKLIGTDVYYIKEGMKLGPNNAEVKAILPGGVVLVEKIRNVYDQDEYLETVLPISSE